MSWIGRLGYAAVLTVSTCAGLLGVLALDNYWRERQQPAFDPSRDQLSATRRPPLTSATASPAPDAPRPLSVLLLHGLAGSHSIWDRVVEELPAEADLLAPDLLGFGESPKPESRYNVQAHLTALDELLERERFAERDPIILVGHSMGSILALAWAELHPERVRGMVLVSLPYYESREQAVQQLSASSWMRRGMLSRNPAYKLLCYAFHGREVPFLGVLTSFPEEVAAAGLEHNWISVRRSLERVVLDSDVAQLLERAPVTPTLVHGSADAVVPHDNLARLASSRPALELITLEQGTHTLPLTHPDVIARRVIQVASDAAPTWRAGVPPR